ncbi:MAG: HlyC/CorC family transporter [Clostridia bacterium]|nr:HlyC/CorC family transporter [Clostridia bacterium]
MDPVPNTLFNLFLQGTPQPTTFPVWMPIVMGVLLLLSAFFSSIASAFSSYNKARIKNMAQSGDKRAMLVVKLDEKYDKLETSVIVLDCITNVTLSVISTLFFIFLIASTDPSREGIATTVAASAVTLAILIFGEIIPRVASRETADKSVLSLCGIVNALVIVLTPLSVIFVGIGRLVGKIFHSKEKPSFTEDELINIVDEAEEEGSLESDEGQLIRSAIEFNDVCAGDILTPRVEVCAISKDESIANIAKTFIENAYSRLPVYGEDMDDIVGVLHEKDFFIAYHNNNKTIMKYLQKPVHVSEHIKIADLLKLLKSKKCHLAIVVDEFGGTMGIVTMEDIIEELIGDVLDEHDEEEASDFKELEDGSYIVQCSAELEEFFEKLELVYPEDEDMPQTVNGFVMKELESFPQRGDCFEYQGYRIEITKTSAKRVEQIHVTKNVKEEGAE